MFFFLEELIDLVSWMLEPSPGERAHIEDVQAHVWTNLPVDVESYSWANIVGCAGIFLTIVSRNFSLAKDIDYYYYSSFCCDCCVCTLVILKHYLIKLIAKFKYLNSSLMLNHVQS